MTWRHNYFGSSAFYAGNYAGNYAGKYAGKYLELEKNKLLVSTLSVN